MANKIDMNMQSDLMAAFEGLLEHRRSQGGAGGGACPPLAYGQESSPT